MELAHNLKSWAAGAGPRIHPNTPPNWEPIRRIQLPGTCPTPTREKGAEQAH